jgi:hypothetical protein
MTVIKWKIVGISGAATANALGDDYGSRHETAA